MIAHIIVNQTTLRSRPRQICHITSNIKINKYRTGETVPKSNTNIVEICEIDTSNTQINDRSLS